MTIKDRVANFGLIQKRTLSATVTRSCKHCGAPGYYHDVPGVNVGCYDPKRKGQPVGDICPNCDTPRQAIENLGKIWEAKYTVWHLLRDRIRTLFAKGYTQ